MLANGAKDEFNWCSLLSPAMPAISAALCDSAPVTGLTHRFYRYPARFSPRFAHTVIAELTDPHDVVIDTFMGGGTSVVEALACGRRVVGLDINPLAEFITRSKTTPLSERSVEAVQTCFARLPTTINLRQRNERHTDWLAYQRNIPWWLRKTLEIALDRISDLNTPDQRRFARVVLIRAAQWALDARRIIPGKAEFLAYAASLSQEMGSALDSFGRNVASAFSERADRAVSKNRRLSVDSVHGVDFNKVVPTKWDPPKLILTSPPYWGVHILYHRWQVRGRRETPAPFWLADRRDGRGAGFYTFGTRNTRETDARYLLNAEEAFRAIASAMQDSTLLVQLVGFGHPERHLPQYLAVLKRAGLEELRVPATASGTALLQRDVPNRKWYTELSAPGREYLLIHRRAR